MNQQKHQSSATTELTNESNSEIPLGTESNKKDAASIPVDVASIITQVDRDTVPPPVPLRPKRGQSPQEPNQRRSFFSRLLCCAPKSVGGSNSQISLVVPSKPSFMLQNHKKIPSNPDSNIAVDAGEKRSGKKLLALDLDETLVHSSFQPVNTASFVITVVIDNISHNIYVIKRPGVDQFLTRLAEHYEIVIYTASLSKYADPLLDLLDPKKTISRRLFRENCVFYDGHYVKDLSLLSRDISQTIIVDNCPTSYIFHPENAIDCTSFFDDPSDVELWQIGDFLESIHNCDDVRAYCRTWREWCKHNPSSAPQQRTKCV